MEIEKLRIAFGNHKLPKTTAIMNITSAADCPGRKLGLCPCPDICYARKAEVAWPITLDVRREHTKAFDAFSAATIANEILYRGFGQKKKKYPMQVFRFSECGDFRDQDDVDKMTEICKTLRRYIGSCYGYTTRKDLNLRKLKRVASVIGSGFMATNKSIVVRRGHASAAEYVCAGDCRKCDVCLVKKGVTIAFPQH